MFPPFISDVFFDGYDHVGAHCGAHSAGDALLGIGNAGRVIALFVQDVGGQSDDLLGASLNATFTTFAFFAADIATEYFTFCFHFGYTTPFNHSDRMSEFLKNDYIHIIYHTF